MVRRWWPWVFLPVTGLAIAMEIYSGVFDGPGTTPWTGYIVHYIPEFATMGLIAILITWLPIHFWTHYASKVKGAPMSDPSTVPPQDASATETPHGTPLVAGGVRLAGVTVPPDLVDEVLKLIEGPKAAESEPLVVRALLVSALCGVLSLIGVRLTPGWRDGMLALAGVLAPVLLALWGRRTTWAPASVRRLLKLVRG